LRQEQLRSLPDAPQLSAGLVREAISEQLTTAEASRSPAQLSHIMALFVAGSYMARFRGLAEDVKIAASILVGSIMQGIKLGVIG